METKKLNPLEKQSVSYCVPNWLRDEQIKLAIQRVKGRIEPVPAKRTEPIAIAGFGPTLKDTWEKIKDFKYVMGCSGATNFLIERGIKVQWHVAVDPLPGNSRKLIGTPHPDVEYLIASTCNPDVFDLLEGFNVKLWHVFDSTEEGLRLLPRGDWYITGGCDVGLRCLTLASFLGFRELHIFGLDGCAPASDAARHAGEHPSKKQPYAECEYEGKTYYTTPAMLEAARQTVHELEQMTAVKAVFYGEGLTQALVAHQYKPVEPNPAGDAIAFCQPELISAQYRELNARLHRENLFYGVGGGRHAPVVMKLAEQLKTHSVLDYGCGKGYLAKEIPWPIWEFDPAIPGKDHAPRPADLVICTDVLEHIEPERIDFVLDDLRRCLKQVGYFTIHTQAARKKLPDGRNTHLIQKDKVWWKKKLEQFFIVGKITEVGPELHVVVGAKKKKKIKLNQAVAA